MVQFLDLVEPAHFNEVAKSRRGRKPAVIVELTVGCHALPEMPLR